MLFFTVRHIKSVDGFTGCYRGLMPKLCSYTVSTIACERTLEYLQTNSEQNEDEDDEEESVRYTIIDKKKSKYNYLLRYNYLYFAGARNVYVNSQGT